jgi:uncharacterized protein DUF6745
LSLIEIARLTDPQRTALDAYGRRWAQVRLSTSTTGDRAAAEAGVAKAYAAAGLPPPHEVVWTASPRQLANSWVRLRHTAGENVRSSVVDTVFRKAEAAADRAVGLSVRLALAGEPRLARVPAFCSSIDEAVHRGCERIRPPLRRRLAELFKLPHRQTRLAFASSSFSFQTSALLGALEYLHDVCGLHRQAGGLAGLWQIAPEASWILPHERICWLSDRPDVIRQDARGRLHSAKGPALRYRDGWSAYAWKGVLIPSWIIERPELLGVRTISAAHDPQIRRCMIDILTPERFIAAGGAHRVSQDETGILWRQRWRWEAWAAVEVVNGSAEKDGTRKRYFLQVPANMRSPREAVAWTYGLSEQRYRPIVRT